MNNRDNAAYIIENYGLNCAQCNEQKDICQTCAQRARFAVDALVDAGLLAPDLPTLRDDYDSISIPTRRTSIRDREHDDFPILYENEDSVLVGVTEGGDVEFSLGMCDEVFVTLTTGHARKFAHALLGAVDYAEKQMAENVADTLVKGMRVIVTGKLKQRSYQTKEGEQRTVYEIEVEDVGPSLKYAVARVDRNERDTNRQQGGGQQQGGGDNPPWS